MTLPDWLSEQNITGYAFARRIGLSHTTVSRWLRGTVLPTPGNIKLVYDATGGRVTANDLLTQG